MSKDTLKIKPAEWQHGPFQVANALLLLSADAVSVHAEIGFTPSELREHRSALLAVCERLLFAANSGHVAGCMLTQSQRDSLEAAIKYATEKK